MKPAPAKTILLVVAMGLTMMSGHYEVSCDGTPHSDIGTNGFLVGDTISYSTCDEDAGHENGHGCESGCRDCNLSCCAGSAMILTTAQSVETAPLPEGQLAISTTELGSIDPDQLYHPPRA